MVSMWTVIWNEQTNNSNQKTRARFHRDAVLLSGCLMAGKIWISEKRVHALIRHKIVAKPNEKTKTEQSTQISISMRWFSKWCLSFGSREEVSVWRFDIFFFDALHVFIWQSSAANLRMMMIGPHFNNFFFFWFFFHFWNERTTDKLNQIMVKSAESRSSHTIAQVEDFFC